MSFLSALFVLVHALLAGAWSTPAPAPHGVTVSPVAPAPAGADLSRVSAPHPRRAHPGGEHAAPTSGPVQPQRQQHPTPAAPTVAGRASCPAGSDWDGVECIPQQRPDEVIGRQIDCPDGTVGTVVDEQLHVRCPGGAPAP